MEKYKVCQSCGMPFKNDPQGGGSNADGSKSAKYCSYCYQRGRFTQPDMTAEKMQALVKGKLREMGFLPKLFAGFFVKSIPHLARWKEAKK